MGQRTEADRVYARATRSSDGVIRRAKLTPHCLINNVTGELTVRSGAAMPNRIGVVDGRTDQHGYAARDHGGGGRPLSISGADGQGGHSRRTLRGDGLASQACGSGAGQPCRNFAGGPAAAKSDLWRYYQGCSGGAVGSLRSNLRQASQGDDSDVVAFAGTTWPAQA